MEEVTQPISGGITPIISFDIIPFDTPIDYRRISEEDFSGALITTLKEAELSDNGYVSDSLSAHLADDLGTSNTVLINAGVGQGKTTSIHRLMEWVIQHGEEYVVIVAVPSLALVEKYYKDTTSTLNHTQRRTVFKLDDTIKRKSEAEIADFVGARIHIMTVNALLANPGDLSYYQMFNKRLYLDNLLTRCSEQGKKVIVILDEIHDAIHNFQPPLIPHFFKWATVLHKAIISTATITEATISLCKHIGKATNYNIVLIQSERRKIDRRRASIEWWVSDKDYTQANVTSLEPVFGKIYDAVDNGEKVNILCYSKTLSQKIGNLLKERTPSLNIGLCTSDEDKFDVARDINVGTSFTTGVNIECGLYVIIFPNYYNCYLASTKKDPWGVFTKGAVGVIQAVARVRNANSRIAIVCPFPSKVLDGDYLTYIRRIPYLSPLLLNGTTDYQEFNRQPAILNRYISRIMDSQRHGVDNIREIERGYISSRYGTFSNVPEIQIETPDTIKLRTADDYLVSTEESYGKSCAPYVGFALLADQFANARLNRMHILSARPRMNEQVLASSIYQYFLSYFATEENPLAFLSHLRSNCDSYLMRTLGDVCINMRVLIGDGERTATPLIKKGILEMLWKYKYRMASDLTPWEYISGNLRAIELQNNGALELVQIVGEGITHNRQLFDGWNSLYNSRRQFLSILPPEGGPYNRGIITNQITDEVMESARIAHSNLSLWDTMFRSKAMVLFQRDRQILTKQQVLKSFIDLFIDTTSSTSERRRIMGTGQQATFVSNWRIKHLPESIGTFINTAFLHHENPENFPLDSTDRN